MPTDYKSHGQRQEKKPLPGFVWLFIGLAIGLFVAFIIYLDKQPENEMRFDEAVQAELDKLKQKKAARKESIAKAEPDSEKSSRFNFYTILPELEVLIPDSELQLDEGSNSNATEGRVLSGDKQYLLQAGSFQQQADAERLKAQLALLGVSARIQPVTINHQRWYRVRIGPLASRSDVYRELNRLQQHDISAMAIELKAE